MTTLSLKISERLDAQLEALARDRNVPKSVLVRETLEQALASRRGPAEAKNALDLVKDLSGSLRGPVDLSTNPKHMDGFGA